MGTRLFVGNLSYSTTEDDLRKFFEEVGDVVSVQISLDRETKRPRGFAFVEMGSEEAAKDAIDKKHDQELDGRNISVDYSKPKTDRPERSNNGYGGNRGGDRQFGGNNRNGGGDRFRRSY